MMPAMKQQSELTLQNLLEGLVDASSLAGIGDIAVTGIAQDSRRVRDNDVFLNGYLTKARMVVRVSISYLFVISKRPYFIALWFYVDETFITDYSIECMSKCFKRLSITNHPDYQWPQRWMNYFRTEPPGWWKWFTLVPGKLASLLRCSGRITVVARKS